MRIDLHTHSRASDGTDAPGDLVRAARAEGLDVVALTDHDTVLGWDEARAAVPDGLELVLGAELSCRVGRTSLHLLAYGFDPAHPPLAAEMAAARDDRLPRAQEMVRRMAADGIPLTWADVAARVPEGATVGRPHIADALVAAGVVPDRDAAFAELLHDTSRYHVGHHASDPVEAVRLVRAAGGASVFAHPRASTRGRTVGDDVVAAMAQAGMVGLEVDHRDHDDAARAHLRGLAGELGLVVTGSSDYHGTGKANRLGENTTDPDAYRALMAAVSPR